MLLDNKHNTTKTKTKERQTDDELAGLRDAVAHVETDRGVTELAHDFDLLLKVLEDLGGGPADGSLDGNRCTAAVGLVDLSERASSDDLDPVDLLVQNPC